jgi:NAD(P)-dependent dehydrogenase (short-subunit alcohol dehydrogenase family)
VSARVIITGAASGIGLATAAALRGRGARVVGLDVQEGTDIIRCDVRDQESVDRAVAEAAERLGGIDVLINSAGIGDPQSAGERPGEDALRVLDINLLGPWRVTGAAMKHLRASRGRVINIASGLAHVTVPFATAYCMSKRGLVGYSDALRIEHGTEITVTTVYPGYIRTPIHRAPEAKGLSLEGMVPAEPLEEAVKTLVRAALGPPARDLATTRGGAIGYAIVRLVPRRLFDRFMSRRLRRSAERGHFDAEGVVSAMRDRLLGRT